MSDVAKGSDSSPVTTDGGTKSPRQPTDFSEFTEEIRKARESADDHDSLDGLANQLESKIEGSNGSSDSGQKYQMNPISQDSGAIMSSSSEREETQTGESGGSIYHTDRSSDILERFEVDTTENFNTSTETLKERESEGSSSSDCDEILHQTDGSNDSYSVRKRSISRQMTITTETVATITKYSEESITSPFKHLSRSRSNMLGCRSSTNSECTGVHSSSSLSRSSLGYNSCRDAKSTDSETKISGGSDDNLSSTSKVHTDGSLSQGGQVDEVTDESESVANASSTSLSTTLKIQTSVKNVLNVCEDTVMETEHFERKTCNETSENLVSQVTQIEMSI